MSVNTIAGPLAVRSRECPLCGAEPGQPCQPEPAGDHLARYLDASHGRAADPGVQLTVLAELVVIDTCAVITVPTQPPGGPCHYCGRDGQRLAPCCDRPEHEHQLACGGRLPGAATTCSSRSRLTREAEYMAEPEGYCIACGESVALFFGYDGPQHFRGPHKLVTGTERRRAVRRRGTSP